MFYFFYQEAPQSVWIPALASERANILRDRAPALCTVLDVDSTFEDDADPTIPKYLGPLYWDIDSEDLETAIEQTKKLLTVLKGHDIDLNTLRCYLTGGRGTHILMDARTFMVKVPPTGTAHLPSIYREMVWSKAFVDDVDMRIYSAKRGRQLRCSNYKRENGLYKVSVTTNELLDMTVEQYKSLCAAPRNEAPAEPAKFNPAFGLAFSVARDKVAGAVARRKSNKKSVEALTHFKGEWPATLALINSGQGLKEGIGFNMVAMQVALTGLALGKTDEQILESCQGLIETHQGDSSRYGSPSKRRKALLQTVRYFRDNPCYEYSTGGVLALLDAEARASADIGKGEYTAPATSTSEDQTYEDEEANPPLKVDSTGVFTRTDQGYVRASFVGIGRAQQLLRQDQQAVGYDVDVYHNNKPIGQHSLTMDKLTSRSAFQAWTFQWSASMSASDIQTAKIADILANRAQKKGDVIRIVTREGIDLVVPRGSKTEDDFEVVWASSDKVISSKEGQYKFRSQLDKDGTYKSDLFNAPSLTSDDADLIRNLLQLNTTENLAKMLGWFSAAFMSQLLRRFYYQFPSLQVFGQAGAGKSKSVQVLNHMHYYMQKPCEMQATGNTQYPMLVAVAASASMPVVFEEVKQREMTKGLRDFLLNLFRSNYDGHSVARGSLTKDAASRDVVVNKYDNSGPLVFVGESVESQSAILERCVTVSLAKHDRYGRTDAYEYLRARSPELGRLGRAMANNVLAMDTVKMRESLESVLQKVKKSLGERADEMSRPAYNIAVVVLGLALLDKTLQEVFGQKFVSRMEELKNYLIDNALANIPANMAEASRVLNTMSQLSRNQELQYQLVQGVDYTINEDGKTMDLKLIPAYSKYIRWVRSLGQEALFDNEAAFVAGMSNYGGTLKRACPDNDELFDSPRAIIYRLKLEYLDKEGVDTFLDKHK